MCGCMKKNTSRSFRSMNVVTTPLTFSNPPGDQEDGYVLAEVLFSFGSPPVSSGRTYPIMRRGEIWYVHPDDIAAHPTWFKAVELELA